MKTKLERITAIMESLRRKGLNDERLNEIYRNNLKNTCEN